MKIKLKIFARYTLLCCLVLFVSSCKNNNKNDSPIKGTAKHTVIVYMMGNNSLNSFISDNLRKMQSTWSDDFDGNCLVILDEPQNYSYVTNNSNLSLLEIQSGSRSRKVIQTYTNKKALDPSDMTYLLEDAMRRYPSDKYTLILWSHGLGWLPTHYYPSLRTRGFTNNIPLKGFGESGSKQMELMDLAKGIPDRAFETIIFDACFMGGIEVVYELKNKAEYIIGAPSEVIAYGFPYHITIPQLMEGKSPTVIANSFIEYYKTLNINNIKAYNSATMGVVKTSELAALAVKTKSFLDNFNSVYPVRNRISEIQIFDRYRPNAFFDFKQTMEILAESGFDKQAQELQAQLDKTVLYSGYTDWFFEGQSDAYRITRSSGLSCYVPSSYNATMISSYKTLSWYKDSGYDVFFNF